MRDDSPGGSESTSSQVDCDPLSPALGFRPLGRLNMPSIHLPEFPEDVPTHPLLVVDYSLLVAGDLSEIDKLWGAATKLGFW